MFSSNGSETSDDLMPAVGGVARPLGMKRVLEGVA
jgi:hypothetical protein